MSTRPPARTPLRTAHYEYCWDVARGTPFDFYPTIKDALANKPAGIGDPHGHLLAQLRWDDDGSLCGRARTVKFKAEP